MQSPNVQKERIENARKDLFDFFEHECKTRKLHLELIDYQNCLFYIFHKDKKTLFYWYRSVFGSSIGESISYRKSAFYKLLDKMQIPYPDLLEFVDIEDGINFLKNNGLVICKPNDRSLSIGVTCDITNTRVLINAIEKAKLESNSILLQKQCRGNEYRFLLINYKVISVVTKQKLKIIGDGQNAISYLIEKTFSKEAKRLTNIDNCFSFVSAHDITAILPKGRELTCSYDSNIVEDAFETIDKKLFPLVESIARVLNQPFCGIDVFINNQEFWVLEMNSSPDITLHFINQDLRDYITDSFFKMTLK